MSTRGARMILAERRRQVQKEGWDSRHDDDHYNLELSWAAECYLESARRKTRKPKLRAPAHWPWEAQNWNPKDPIRDLVRAGALIAAEIDRLLRDQPKPGREG